MKKIFEMLRKPFKWRHSLQTGIARVGDLLIGGVPTEIKSKVNLLNGVPFKS